MSGKRAAAATRHWRNQRITSIALIPLALWFLFAFLRQPGLDHATVSAWLGRPLPVLLAALFGATMLWHSMQGVTVVLEDYVRGRAFAAALWISRLAHLVGAAALAWALWMLASPGA
jgi:succinate dehydrogenase / fumarate reductase membrane anchor subunit